MECTLQLTKKRLGVFVEKSTFPGIHRYDEVVEINNVSVHLLDEATLQHQLSELNISNFLILPHDKQQLIQTCLNFNNVYCEKSRISTLTEVQYSSDNLIQVMSMFYRKPLFCSKKI
jgi:aminopeptidase-like protein